MARRESTLWNAVLERLFAPTPYRVAQRRRASEAWDEAERLAIDMAAHEIRSRLAVNRYQSRADVIAVSVTDVAIRVNVQVHCG